MFRATGYKAQDWPYAAALALGVRLIILVPDFTLCGCRGAREYGTGRNAGEHGCGEMLPCR